MEGGRAGLGAGSKVSVVSELLGLAGRLEPLCLFLPHPGSRRWQTAGLSKGDMNGDGSECRRSESRCRDGEVRVLTGNSCLHSRGSGAQTAEGGRWPI